MKQLPEYCHECAEYGSEFCQECLDELAAELNPDDCVKLSQVIKNIANVIKDEDSS